MKVPEGNKLLWLLDHCKYKARWHRKEAGKWGGSRNEAQREQHQQKADEAIAWAEHWEQLVKEITTVIEKKLK